VTAPPCDRREQRASLAAARIRQELPVDDAILDEILGRTEDLTRIEFYTAAERDDIARDRELVAQARWPVTR
jgi:hypothetical protein